MLLGVRFVLIVPFWCYLSRHRLATQIPRILCSSWCTLCLRYANSPFRVANESSTPLTVAKNKGHPHGVSLFFGAGIGVFVFDEDFSPCRLQASLVSLRFGHARGKTTLSCFLALSRRFATRSTAQMRTPRENYL